MRVGQRVGLYWRTLRHLRATQLLHQVARILAPRPAPRRAKGRWSEQRGSLVQQALAAFGPVDSADRAAASGSAWASGQLTWLGLQVPWTGDWSMPGPSPLWRYHLHYHEHLANAAWLAAQHGNRGLAEQVLADLRRWLAAWAQGGAPAWDAYPVSVRLVNWLRVLSWAAPLRPASESAGLRESIAVHTELLRRALEWHLEGNHLLRNAWALTLGSACLEGSPVALAEASALFADQLTRQVHADGWHEERTPMYHARALRDALEVEAALATLGEPLSAAASARIAAMREALAWMRRADGSLWQLNDSSTDHGVDLDSPGMRHSIPPAGLRWFRNAEVAVYVAAHADRVRLDLGGPAPAHQPGHAHAGALGIEVDIGGLPLVVDGGVAGYDGDPWRGWLRGTSAHSTVTVDARDQSELWATFRVGARARVHTESVEATGEGFRAVARCMPYHSPVEHVRVVTRIHRQLVIDDRVEGAAGRRVEGYLHFAPEWDAQPAGDGAFELTRGGVRVGIHVTGPDDVTLHRAERKPLLGWRARGFNDVVPAFALRMRATAYRGNTWRTTIVPD